MQTPTRQPVQPSSSEQCFAAIMNSSPDLIAQLDRQFRYICVNPVMERALGLPREQLIGATPRETGMPAALAALWMSKLRQAFSGRQELTFEFAWPFAEGMRHYHALLVPQPAAEVSGESVVVIARDITQLHAMQESLRRRVEEWRTLFDAIPVGLVIAEDTKCQALRGNAVLDRLLEAQPGQGLSRCAGQEGRPTYRCLHNGRELRPEELPLQVAAATGLPVMNFELDVELGKRTLRMCCNAVPLLDENRRPRGAVGAFWDIAPFKRVESELREQTAAAQAASGAKDRLLAVLSHELRTPLTPVLLIAATLQKREDLPPGVHDDIMLIRRHIELEARLIDDLLDVTRMTRGKLGLRWGRVDVHAVVRHVMQLHENGIRSKRLRVRVDLSAEQSLVRGDAARMEQVFWNLLSNAIKFTPAGGEIRIRSWNDSARQFNVSLEDSGVGFDPRSSGRIFEAFEQADGSVRRQFGGLGLGLAIVKALVEMHGGRISAHSEGTGRGAAFTIVLQTVDPSTPHVVDDFAPSPPLRRGLRILLVEDHEMTAAAMERVLRGFGHLVTVAATAGEALDAAARDRFDIVISDIGLPDRSGHELMRDLRTRHGLRGVALSGFGMDEDLRRSRQAGFSAHLVKPVDPEELDAIVQEACGG